MLYTVRIPEYSQPQFTIHDTRMAGLTIKHGTHVRRAPGWKGAPE